MGVRTGNRKLKFIRMKKRTNRLLAIKQIVRENRIANQDELLEKLSERGLKYTQATLSRDLKFLKIGKIAYGEDYVYILPESRGVGMNEEELKTYPVNGFVSLDFSLNIAVIRTLPGYAGSIAFAIDQLRAYEILGTIAGDDTIIIVIREGTERRDLKNLLAMIIPELKEY
jgi:transcriptional regulator of arginine metabolism